jgi:hypothetical protein
MRPARLDRARPIDHQTMSPLLLAQARVQERACLRPSWPQPVLCQTTPGACKGSNDFSAQLARGLNGDPTTGSPARQQHAPAIPLGSSTGPPLRPLAEHGHLVAISPRPHIRLNQDPVGELVLPWRQLRGTADRRTEHSPAGGRRRATTSLPGLCCALDVRTMCARLPA